jgi:hypothetical protein
MGNLEFACLDTCGNVLILYIVSTNDTWTHSMDNFFPI